MAAGVAPDSTAAPPAKPAGHSGAEVAQLTLSFCGSWDPYEIWCTRVRAHPREEGSPAAVPVEVNRSAADFVEKLAGVPRFTSGTPSTLMWPVLLLVLTLGLNRELVGLFRVDLVSLAFGVMTPAARVVHALLGLSALCVVVMALRPPGQRGRVK